MAGAFLLWTILGKLARMRDRGNHHFLHLNDFASMGLHAIQHLANAPIQCIMELELNPN